MMAADPKALGNLIKLYRDARDRLLNTIVNFKGVGTKVYANTVLKQLEGQLKNLERQSTAYAESVIPEEYRNSLDEVYEYFQKNNLLMTPQNAVFAQLHADAVYAIAREMQFQTGQGLAQVGRQIQRYVETARDDALRAAGLEASGEKFATGGTIDRMRSSLIQRLQTEGFMTVQYGSGPRAYQVGLDSYAAMVARSTTREATNTAKLNAAEEHGYDLVRVTEHYPTCDVCAPLQGRVYSRTGKDPRFPPLNSLPGFNAGYKTFHPNCRHVVTVTVEALWTDDERARYLGEASKPTTGDTRSRKEIDRYNNQQKANRQFRQDLYQYERYKARLGKDAPKNFTAFRRLKNAGGDAWADLQYYYRNKGDRPIEFVKIDRELSKLNIKKGKAYPADNGFQVSSWRAHAERRLAEAGITKEEVLRWKHEAKVMLKRFPEPQTQLNYYHNDGIIGIREKDGRILTVIDKSRFGNDTKAILEVIQKHV